MSDREPTPYEQASEEVKRLLRMLSVRRRHNSPGEEFFYDAFLSHYQPTPFIDDTGEELAYVLTNEPDEANPSGTLWSCHIDTVHGAGDAKLQNICYDPFLQLVYKEDHECLGADNGAGVWLLLEMFDAGVPGTYVFHRGEECGGIGSRGMARHHTEWLKQFKRAVAFDRRKDCSVITHQAVGRCCSDDFGKALAELLSDAQYKLAPDDTGSFTDTASYVDLIGECTNVSVGYELEHSGNETLDVDYLLWLRARMIEVGAGFTTLPSKRAPGEKDFNDWGWGGYEGYWTPKRETKLRLVKPETVSAYDIDRMLTGDLRKWVHKAKEHQIVQLIQQLAGEAVEANEEVMRLEQQLEDYAYDQSLKTAMDLDDDYDGLGFEARGRYAG